MEVSRRGFFGFIGIAPNSAAELDRGDSGSTRVGVEADHSAEGAEKAAPVELMELIRRHGVGGGAVRVRAGRYVVRRNVRVSLDVSFDAGARVVVQEGAQVVFDGALMCGDSVIFEGQGDVVVNAATLNVAWFDGNSLDEKWRFLSRGLGRQRPWSVRIPRPPLQDPAGVDVVGRGRYWRLNESMSLDDRHSLGIVQIEGPIAWCGGFAPMIEVGASDKPEDICFPFGISLYGGRTASAGVKIHQGARLNFQTVRVVGCAGPGVVASGLGSEGTNDCSFGHLTTGLNAGPSVELGAGGKGQIRALSFAKIEDNGVRRVREDVRCIVYIGGRVRGVRVDEVRHSPVKAGYEGCSEAIVIIESRNGEAPQGPIDVGIVHQVNSNLPALLTKRERIGDPMINGVSIRGPIYQLKSSVALDLAGLAQSRVFWPLGGRVFLREDCRAIDIVGFAGQMRQCFGADIGIQDGRLHYMRLALRRTGKISIAIPDSLRPAVEVRILDPKDDEILSASAALESRYADGGRLELYSTINVSRGEETVARYSIQGVRSHMEVEVVSFLPVDTDSWVLVR